MKYPEETMMMVKRRRLSKIHSRSFVGYSKFQVGYSRKIKGTDKVKSMKYPEETMMMVIVRADSRAAGGWGGGEGGWGIRKGEPNIVETPA